MNANKKERNYRLWGEGDFFIPRFFNFFKIDELLKREENAKKIYKKGRNFTFLNVSNVDEGNF